jgi:hypothetical protein
VLVLENVAEYPLLISVHEHVHGIIHCPFKTKAGTGTEGKNRDYPFLFVRLSD